MPSVSTMDYQDLLQKITALERKVQRIEVNAEINGLYGNETTLPLFQNSGNEQANTRLRGRDNTTKQEGASAHYIKSPSDNPPWNCLGAKPRTKSCLWETGGRDLGWTQRAEICDETDWPSLPTRQRASSTPVRERRRDSTAANGKVSQKLSKQPKVKLQNRFVPLLENPGSLSDDHLSQGSEMRTDNLSESERPQRKPKMTTETLIVGDFSVKDVQWICGKNTKVLCFPKDMVSDMQKRILKTVTKYPTVKNIVLHTGSNDVSKQQSEVLKRDFAGLITTASSLDAAVFISGPLPSIRGGEERFSRLLALNKWISSACADKKLNFIDNFQIFWERRHLFKANGFSLNRSGVRLFTSNVFHFLRHPSVLGAKKEIYKDLSQKEDQTELSAERGKGGGGGASSALTHGKLRTEAGRRIFVCPEGPRQP